MVLDGDPTVFPDAHTNEPSSWGRGGGAICPGVWSPLLRMAEVRVLTAVDSWHPFPRWRMEQSTSWRPSTPCRSTRGWLTSRAVWTLGKCPSGTRTGGQVGGSYLVLSSRKRTFLMAVLSRLVPAVHPYPHPYPQQAFGGLLYRARARDLEGSWIKSCSHPRGA